MVAESPEQDLRRSALRPARTFDYATLSVIVVGAALWMCWPRAVENAHARIPARTYVSYGEVSDSVLSMAREPLLFVEYALTNTPGLRDEVTEMRAELLASNPSAPVPLPQFVGPPSIFDLSSVVQTPVPERAVHYHPRWEDRAVFSLTNIVIAAHSVTMSPALERVNLNLPEWKTSFERFSAASWRAVFELSGSGIGAPDDVFVVESSGNTELDQWFALKLYEAHAREDAGPWRGLVSLSAQND